MCLCVYVYLCVFMCMCVYVYVCMYACMYVCMYICVCVLLCVSPLFSCCSLHLFCAKGLSQSPFFFFRQIYAFRCTTTLLFSFLFFSLPPSFFHFVLVLRVSQRFVKLGKIYICRLASSILCCLRLRVLIASPHQRLYLRSPCTRVLSCSGVAAREIFSSITCKNSNKKSSCIKHSSCGSVVLLPFRFVHHQHQQQQQQQQQQQHSSSSSSSSSTAVAAAAAAAAAASTIV